MKKLYKPLLIIEVLLLLVHGGVAFGQNYYVIGQDSAVLETDSVYLSVENYRGQIQWQASTDSINWSNVIGGNEDTLLIVIDSTSSYRAMISENSCDPVFSDTFLLRAVMDDVKREVYKNLLDSAFVEMGLHDFMRLIEEADTLFKISKSTVYDADTDRTTATIRIDSIAENLDSLTIIEYIPKEIARSVSEIEFLIPPSKVLKDDPIVMWHLAPSDTHGGDIKESSLEYSYKGDRILTGITLVSDGRGYSVPEGLRVSPPYFSMTHWSMYANSIFLELEVATQNTEIQEVGLYYGVEEDVESTGTHIILGEGDGLHEIILTGLQTETRYYFMYYVVDEVFGEISEFKDVLTLRHTTDVINDYEGNTYRTVQIGTQWWMAENLASTKYNDGTKLTLLESDEEWSAFPYNSPGYCWLNNDTNGEGDRYGALYNQGAVTEKNLCPAGWHVPNDEDWIILESFIGLEESELNSIGRRGESLGHVLKATTGWKEGTDASDAHGFSALPVGSRQPGGTYNTYYNTSWRSVDGYYRHIEGWEGIYRYQGNYDVGFSVRCVKD